MSIHFGTDPEYLIVDSYGRPIPAHKAGMPPKESKMILNTGSSEDGSKAFRDGYMVEINVAPSHCRQSMSFRMQRAIKKVNAKLMKYHYHLIAVPAVKINLAKDMTKAPLDVKQFGCEPSFCAYDGVTKVPPIDAMTHQWRYAGGHLHFSPEKGYAYPDTTKVRFRPSWMANEDNYPLAIKLMDQYVGLPLTCLFHSRLQYQRRKWYGQAGEYRPQKYPDGEIGLEYRTPGPEIWNLPWLSSLALGIGRHIMMNFGHLAKQPRSKMRDEAVRNAINTGEGRWTLLKDLPDSPYKAAIWKQVYLYHPRTSTPGSLLLASAEVIKEGFGDWWKKKGHTF